MKEYRAWLLVVGILIILGLGAWGVVQVIRETTRDALAPIAQGSDGLRTQVAEFLHPTPTVIPDPITLVKEIKPLARLETIQYSVEKVITAETDQGIFQSLFGDRLLFVAHGTVIAGLDLGKLQPGDISIQDGVVTVILPPAEIFVSTLDNSKSYVYNRQTGVFTHGDTNLETTARRAAETEILKAAVEDGVLDQARQNGENYLSGFLRSLGYSNVIFKTGTPVPGLTPEPSATPLPN
jgi:hypothetical protein